MSLDVTEEAHESSPLSTKGGVIFIIVSLILGGVIFTLAYLGLSHHSGIGQLNQPLLSWVMKHRYTPIINIMKEITAIASPVALGSITAIIAIIWAISKCDVWRPTLLVGGMSLAVAVSTALKNIIANPRPPLADMLKPFETDFSFPSGHTIGTLVFLLIFGYLIYSRRFTGVRMTIWLFAAFIGAAIVAATRIYLGYHWLTDVVASFGLGLIILAVVVAIDKLITSKFQALQ